MSERCHSDHTQNKHAALRCILRVALPVIDQVNKRLSWSHDRPLIVDTHGGPGMYSTGPGSPVIAEEVCRELHIDADLVAYEIDDPTAEQLKSVYGGHVFSCGYEEMPSLFEQIGGKRFGLINVDPRGAKDFDPMPIFHAMREDAGRYMDIIVHASQTASRRARDIELEDKLAVFEEIGFERIGFSFTQDRGNTLAWHWQMWFLTRSPRDSYVKQIRDAARQTGHLAEIANVEQLALEVVA